MRRSGYKRLCSVAATTAALALAASTSVAHAASSPINVNGTARIVFTSTAGTVSGITIGLSGWFPGGGEGSAAIGCATSDAGGTVRCVSAHMSGQVGTSPLVGVCSLSFAAPGATGPQTDEGALDCAGTLGNSAFSFTPEVILATSGGGTFNGLYTEALPLSL